MVTVAGAEEAGVGGALHRHIGHPRCDSPDSEPANQPLKSWKG